MDMKPSVTDAQLQVSCLTADIGRAVVHAEGLLGVEPLQGFQQERPSK